jgi:hypothetical protein
MRYEKVPTLMIYKQGQMIWRQAGELDANTIISLVQEQFSNYFLTLLRQHLIGKFIFIQII